MNLVAHLEVAQRVGHDAAGEASHPLFLAGSILPDVATMGRFRLQPDRTRSFLRSGLAIHHRTDAAFHDDRRFLDLVAGLRSRLADSGVARGPARACGHVGIELLLDGCLMADPLVDERVRAVVRTLGARDPDVLDAVAPVDAHRWQEHLTLVCERLDPTAYRDPARIAAILERMLADRTLLAMADGDHHDVRRGLEAVQRDVQAIADAIVQDTVQAVV